MRPNLRKRAYCHHDYRCSLAEEITEQNFVAWCHVEIQTSEADGYLTNRDVYCSLHVAVVNTTAGEHIGYLRIGA